MQNNQGLKADNINVITELFPDGNYKNLGEFLNVMEKKTKTFGPVGEMIEEFKIDDSQTFQIYLCKSSTANFQQHHARHFLVHRPLFSVTDFTYISKGHEIRDNFFFSIL